jgi:phosphoenolpyruvate---glycerone phosphotransferase subunit DhaL
LTPAIAAMTAAAAAGKTIPQALEEAASAAHSGAEATKDLVARYGRARSLGERTRGYADAGATSIALLFKGFSTGLARREHGNG